MFAATSIFFLFFLPACNRRAKWQRQTALTNCTHKDQREKRSIRGGEGRRGEEWGGKEMRGGEGRGKGKEENKGPHPGVFRKFDI